MHRADLSQQRLRQALLERWQRDFPLVPAPFAALADALGDTLDATEDAVLRACAALRESGAIGRIGGLFAAGAGGAGALGALAVPPARLAEVAALVSARPEVNHNYAREHRWNLWFVVHAANDADIARTLDAIEADTRLPLLRLPMRRAYRIDLGFGLRGQVAAAVTGTRGEAPAPIARADWPLAALVEAGLPLVPRPFDAWAAALGRPVEALHATLARWLADGTLRRFGLVVRHHELGFAANAMAVFAPPEDVVDALGAALAREPGVTLAYRRAGAPGWPYTLYAMLHGRDRASVQALAQEMLARTGLDRVPHELLFSTRRFKQTGARRFRALVAQAGHAA